MHAYNVQINTIIGHLGNVEHLRDLCDEPQLLKPNCLYWMTDRTPHESLPLSKDTHRQFFRLMTNQVSVWFEADSTRNPFGVVPPPSTRVVQGSKFEAAAPRHPWPYRARAKGAETNITLSYNM